ncbi:MAG: Hint domain-containing protein, partial [Pseudomonadota bacterium]
MSHDAPHAAHNLPVLRAEDVRVTDGANIGDVLSCGDELLLDDIYTLASGAEPFRLSLHVTDQAHMTVAEGSAIGVRGATIHLDCAITLMPTDGEVVDAIVLVEVDDDGAIAAIYLLPMAPLGPRTPYALVGIDRKGARERLAQMACARFTRGTHITMASGAQIPIEHLNVGDRVLTRNDGVQDVRWIGQSTVRAVGDFAPIRITAGTLNNLHD